MSLSALAVVLAAGSTSNPYTPTFPGGFVAWFICSRRKKQQIGGWLLFYYWQLYSGALMSVVFFAIGFQSYVPESFDDPGTYHLFLASALPNLLFLAFEVAVGTLLVSIRTWDILWLLRWIMITGLLSNAFATLVDIKYFPDNLVFDALTIIQGIPWLAYFFLSRRVRHVFKSHDWDSPMSSVYPPAFNSIA